MESVIDLPELKSEIKAEDFCSTESTTTSTSGDSSTPQPQQQQHQQQLDQQQQVHHQQQNNCNWVGQFFYKLKYLINYNATLIITYCIDS